MHEPKFITDQEAAALRTELERAISSGNAIFQVTSSNAVNVCKCGDPKCHGGSGLAIGTFNMTSRQLAIVVNNILNRDPEVVALLIGGDLAVEKLSHEEYNKKRNN